MKNNFSEYMNKFVKRNLCNGSFKDKSERTNNFTTISDLLTPFLFSKSLLNILKRAFFKEK